MSKAELIAKVLGQYQERDPDPVLDMHQKWISDRYRELKQTRSFAESAFIAKAEWVQIQLDGGAT